MSESLGEVQDRTFARSTAATAASYPPQRRLNAAQLDRMTAYVRRGVTFWLPSVSGSVRERNLSGTPWLTLVITEGDHGAHIAVLIERRGRRHPVLAARQPASSSSSAAT